MTLRLAIVTPVFNDWESLRHLLADLAESLRERDCSVEVVAVDDCSFERAPDDFELAAPIRELRVSRLASNMGHQRAIAVGLASLVARDDIDFVAVMDCDGEDRPADLARLLDTVGARPGLAAIAQRAKRSEGAAFRFLYKIYVLIFRLLTGHRIDFGNFCLLPFGYLDRLVSRPDIWNNFAATIIRSRIPLERVATARGQRYAGQSRMNFAGLIAHGLGAMSVFSEVVFVRILFASGVLLALVGLGIVGVVGVKFLTSLAIPGWTTNVLGFLVLIGIQAVMMAVMMAFLLLNARSSMQTMPVDFAQGFVRESRVVAVSSFAAPPSSGG